MDTITTAQKPIHYPEGDGKRMGETDLHSGALIYLREGLKGRRCKAINCSKASTSECRLPGRGK